MGTFLVAQTVKHLSTMRETGFNPWVEKIPWRRRWQSTPVLLLGKSHGQRSLVGYSPWGRKESDMTSLLLSLDDNESNQVSCIAGGFFTNWAVREAQMTTLVFYKTSHWSCNQDLLIQYLFVEYILCARSCAWPGVIAGAKTDSIFALRLL